MIIDAHQHFWTYDPVRDDWLKPQEMEVIRRDFTPTHLEPLLKENGINSTVAVQVSQNLVENQFLLSLAEQHDSIAAVVGWIDLKADNLKAQLETYTSENKLVGFRHILQAEPYGFMTDPAFLTGVMTLGEMDFTYDLLIYEDQLAEAQVFLKALSDQKIIIDHLAKPDIKHGSFKDWRAHLHMMAQYPNVYCKISGMVTEASWSSWTYQDLKPYMQEALEVFGSKRCVYGSDWPVCTLAASYSNVFGVVRKFIAELSEAEQADILGNNCQRFYGIST